MALALQTNGSKDYLFGHRQEFGHVGILTVKNPSVTWKSNCYC
jgi:hypothetical protein